MISSVISSHPDDENRMQNLMGLRLGDRCSDRSAPALGSGPVLEEVYEEALCMEFELRKIPFIRQERVGITYKGRPVGKGKLTYWWAAVSSSN
jgi:hypothetical protein